MIGGFAEYDAYAPLSIVDELALLMKQSSVRYRYEVHRSEFVAEWKQFGRPSDVAIDKNDVLHVADDQSNEARNPGFKTGIRIGSAKDGKVAAFIPITDAPEGVGFDDAGNVFASWTGKMAVARWTK